MKTISEKHLRVLDFWYENHCRSKAAALMKVGYAKQTSHDQANRVFGLPEVKEEIERRQAELRQKNELTIDWVISRLQAVASAPEKLAKYIKITEDGKLDWDFTDASIEDLSLINDLAVESYLKGRGKDGAQANVLKFKIGLSDRKAALDSLARILGMFDDSMTLKGELTMVERLHAGRARVKRTEIGDRAQIKREGLEHLK